MKTKAPIALALFGFLAAGPLSAQEPGSSGPTRYDHGSAPVARAAPLRGDIDLDGRLDEPAWQAAQPVTDFTQFDPQEGARSSQATEVRILVGEREIYIGARLYESDPSRIQSRLARRDERVESDIFEVYLDTYHDHLSAYYFRVTPAGAIRDAVVGSDGRLDTTWDAVWEAAAEIDSLGWIAELRIPLSQVRYNPEEDAVWGVQFGRFSWPRQEQDYFTFTPKSEQGGVSRYGHLVGLGRLPEVERLEILPYVSSRAEYLNVAPDHPFRDEGEYDVDAGVDLKYGVTSDLTLDATVNPDFGQVEVDPAVVNLSAFETFFDEKRPFFIEGADIFDFGQLRTNNSSGFQRVFHARRIGREPQRALAGPAFHFVDAPLETTILGAAKLTGKTARGWSVGLLEAVTDEEEARFLDSLGQRQDAPVEPYSNYFVGRLRRDLRQGDTVLGGILTTVHRDLEERSFKELLRSSSYVGGVDVNHAWADRDWTLDGFLAASHIRGSEEAIARAQRSSARYYQRPDAGYVDFDPARTTFSGYTAQAALQKGGGEHWLGSLTYQETSPGYELNDVGFISTVDRRAAAWIVIYKEDRPGRVLRNWNVFGFSNHIWNFGGDPIFHGAAAAGNVEFLNYWGGHWRIGHDFEAQDDKLTRGGPLAESPAGGHIRLELSSDRRKSVTVEGGFFWQWNDADGWFREAELSIEWRPTPAAQLRFEPSLERLRDPGQFVTSVEDPLAAATFGRRHVFATLDQTTVAFDTRVNWTFTPALSLQLFLQPLLVASDFRDLKEFLQPETFEFGVYGREKGTIERSAEGIYTVDPDAAGPAAAFQFDDPTFNFRSLRGNAVLRWEYRPGSTLFFVWQQERQDVSPFAGDFDFGRDFDALFDADPEDVFLIKATYWFGS